MPTRLANSGERNDAMAVIERTMSGVDEPGWHPDPTGEHNLRYFNGTVWTDHVTHHGPMPCSGCGSQRELDIRNS